MKISDAINKRSNNLNLLKFVAALLVIYSHASAVCGHSEREGLRILLGSGELTFGGLAVAIFLFSSGLFVTKSLINSSTKEYVKKRFVRIYPCFLLVLLVSALVMGPLVTSYSVSEYFTSAQTYKYLCYAVLLPVYELPGVFVGNPTNLVNGSLWTIILECICYVGIWIAFKCKMLNQKVLKWIIPVAFVMCVGIFVIKPTFLYQFSSYIRPLFCFLAGVIFYVFQDKIVIKAKYGIGMGLLLIVFCWFDYASMGIILFLPYIICCIAFSKKQCPAVLAKLGNYSYCLYLVAFPIQQIVWQYFDGFGRTIAGNTLLSCIFACIVGLLLYHFVEHPIARKFR